MSKECGWVESRIEDLFSPDPVVQRSVDAHIRSCPACRREVEDGREMDQLLKATVRSRMRRAVVGQVGPGPARRLALAGAVAAAAAVVVWIGVTSDRPAPAPVPSAAGIEPVEDALAKPTDGVTAPTPDSNTVDAALPEDASFYVVDAAGYGYTLNDFGGTVVVLGVFDEAEADSLRFGRLRESVPSQTDLRFLAVGSTPGAPDAAGGLSLMTNRGSALVGTAVGEFAILTRSGNVYRRGLMSDPQFEEIVRTSLAELDLDTGE